MQDLFACTYVFLCFVMRFCAALGLFDESHEQFSFPC